MKKYFGEFESLLSFNVYGSEHHINPYPANVENKVSF